MGFPVAVGLNYGDEKIVVTDNDRGRALGTVGLLPDGRIFRWARAGSSALNAGDVIQARVVDNSTHAVGQLISTAGASGNSVASGGTTVPVLWATTIHTSGVYVDGYMTVETTPGSGVYRVISDPSSAASGGNTRIVLHEDDPLVDALTTVSRLGFHSNPYNAVIQNPATGTSAIVGVVPGVPGDSVAANAWFWAQTGGIAAVEYNTGTHAIVAGQAVVPDTSTAGVITGVIDTTPAESNVGQFALPRLGIAFDGIPDDTDLITVKLSID